MTRSVAAVSVVRAAHKKNRAVRDARSGSVFKLHAKPTLGRGVFRKIWSLLCTCGRQAGTAALLNAATISPGLTDLATGAAGLEVRLTTAIGNRLATTGVSRGFSDGRFTRSRAASNRLTALTPANFLALGGLAPVAIEQSGRCLVLTHHGKAGNHHHQGGRPCHSASHDFNLL